MGAACLADWQLMEARLNTSSNKRWSTASRLGHTSVPTTGCRNLIGSFTPLVKTLEHLLAARAFGCNRDFTTFRRSYQLRSPLRPRTCSRNAHVAISHVPEHLVATAHLAIVWVKDLHP
jgi:hypothetical protein